MKHRTGRYNTVQHSAIQQSPVRVELFVYRNFIRRLGLKLETLDRDLMNMNFSKYFELTGALKGFIVSSALLGALVGAAGAGLLSKEIGRKSSLIISAVLFAISAWGSGLPDILPESISLMVFFRILGGIAIGIASMNAPMYIAEISPADKRGKLVTYYQMAVVIGFFVVFLCTYFIGNGMSESENVTTGWRYMFWSELIPALLFFVLLFMVPRSPRWLMIKGREEEAKNILTRIHGEELANKEFAEMKANDTSLRQILGLLQ